MITNAHINNPVLEGTTQPATSPRRTESPIRKPKVVVELPASSILELEAAANARSTRNGIAYGFAVGVILGLAQLAYIGNGVWSTWGAAMLPIYSGLGWALIGSIVGCGGILAGRSVGSDHAGTDTQALK